MPDINIGQLSEAINNKMDRDLNNRSDDSGLRKLVESYVNGAYWYKVFDEIQTDGSIKKWILFDCPQYTYERTVDCIYWIGQFDKNTCKFIADNDEPQLFDLGDGIYTGQTGFCYLTEEDIANGKTRYEDGRTVIIALAQGKSAGTDQNITAGWAHNLAMPVDVYLDTDGKTVLREPIPELASAYTSTLFEYNGVEASTDTINNLISNIRSDSAEIKFKAKLSPSSDNFKSGLYVRYNNHEIGGLTERTAITFNNSGVYVNRKESTFLTYPKISDTHTYVTDEKEFDITILLDRSLLEVYVNNKITITTRIYPKYGDSDYFHFFDEFGGMTLSDISIKEFGSVYFEQTTPSYYGNNGNMGDLVG